MHPLRLRKSHSECVRPSQHPSVYLTSDIDTEVRVFGPYCNDVVCLTDFTWAQERCAVPSGAMKPSLATSGAAEVVPARSVRIDPAGSTVGQLLDEFESLERIKDTTKGWLHDLVGGVREAIETMGWVWPGQMTAASIAEYLERRKAKGNSPKYRNDIRGYLAQFCAFCVRKEEMETNPVDLVPRAKVKKRRARYVPTIDEVVRLIVAASMDWRKKDRWLVYLVAASTGCRVGTLRKLEWHHIKWGRGCAWLELPAEILKAGDESHVWLTRECSERLKTHMENGGGKVVGQHRFVFESVPKPEGFDRDIAKAGLLKKAAPGAPTFARNSLRHFSTTWLAGARRFTDEDRASQMSHASPAMTNGVYTARNHEILGRSAWLMQPLLPSEFTGNRGRRNGGQSGSGNEKSDGQNLKRGGDRAEDVDATLETGSTHVHAFQQKREPSAEGHLGHPDVAVTGQSDSLAGGSPLCWDALPGPTPRLSEPEQGKRFKSAYPDFGERDPDLNGALRELADAQQRVIEAQARLIRRLQIGAVDGQRSEASHRGTV